jgi:hypothetical protein
MTISEQNANSPKRLTLTPVGDEIEEKKEKKAGSSKWYWLF